MAWNIPGSGGGNRTDNNPGGGRPRGGGSGGGGFNLPGPVKQLFDGGIGRWVALAVGLGVVFSSFQLIGEQQRGVVLRFGQFHRVLQPGPSFKDALAGTGKGKILRAFPLVGGIDVAGEVVASTDPAFREGDRVIATGCGLSETRDGGYSHYVRLESKWAIPLPACRTCARWWSSRGAAPSGTGCSRSTRWWARGPASTRRPGRPGRRR